MQKLNILPKKKIKEILSMIKKQWGAELKTDYAFLKNEKGKIYIVNKDISEIDLEKIRINALGLYFAEIKNNEIRLSIEGSQIIGKKAEKNILEITKEEAKEWMKGKDIQLKGDKESFQLIKSGKDFLGTGKIKNNKLYNFVSKARRIN